MITTRNILTGLKFLKQNVTFHIIYETFKDFIAEFNSEKDLLKQLSLTHDKCVEIILDAELIDNKEIKFDKLNMFMSMFLLYPEVNVLHTILMATWKLKRVTYVSDIRNLLNDKLRMELETSNKN